MADKPEEKKQEEMKRESAFIRVVTGAGGVNPQEILEILSIAIIVIHVIMMFMYHIMGVWQLALYNIIVIAYYSYCYTTVREGKIFRGYLLTFIEIVFQMVITMFIIGWESGFYTYVISIIPVYYYISMFIGGTDHKKGEHVFTPMIWSFVTLAVVLATYITDQFVTPMVTLETAPLKVAFTFNVFFASMLIIWMSHFFVLGYKNSIDILAKKNTTLDEEASLDPLTGLCNRRTMEVKLEDALGEAKKTGALFSLVMGDIDFFKRINDTYGHECGDVALVQVAEILKTCVRDGDVVCRWGGEEFLLLVKGNRNVASNVAERIRARIENNVVEYGENRITFTMTLGVSTYAPGYSLESLVTQADENLYYGKEHGRNRVVSTKPKVTSTVSSNV